MNEILVTQENGLATITLNRPDKRNALNETMVKALLHALKSLTQDETIEVLLINANGDNFCAGADLKQMHKVANASYSENYDDAQVLADVLLNLYQFPKPTIVLARGTVLGGGMGLVAACDIAIAAQETKFGFPEVKIGITPSMISPYIINAIGERAAHYYFLTGELFLAEDARRLGLIHNVVKHEELQPTGETLANTLMQNSVAAMISAKQLIRMVTGHPMSAMLAQKTAEHLAQMRSSKAAKEGLQAFIEKRKPNFKGKENV